MSRRLQYMLGALALAVLGVLALIGGILYLSDKSSKLPSFMPGAAKTGDASTVVHKYRGDGGVAVGVVLLIASVGTVVVGFRPPSERPADTDSDPAA